LDVGYERRVALMGLFVSLVLLDGVGKMVETG
jgi:hypothetical protein